MIDGSIDKKLQKISSLKKKNSPKSEIIQSIERKQPKVEKKKSVTSDQQFNIDGKTSSVNQLAGLMLWHPFMKLFEFCAHQQNHRGNSGEKAVYLYAVKHPNFYRLCIKSEYVLHVIATGMILFFIGFGLYKAVIK